MELELTTEQEILRATTGKYVDTFSLPAIRDQLDRETGLPDGYLVQGADLGWFSMLVPEEYGGGSVSGEEICDLAIVAEERGRALQPGPFVSMNVAIETIALHTPDPFLTAHLSEFMSGERIITWAFSSNLLNPGEGKGLHYKKIDDQFQVTGRAEYVQEGNFSNWFLVTAEGELGLSQFLISRETPGVSATRVAGHDITQRYAAVDFEDVIVPRHSMIGSEGEAQVDFDRQIMRASLLVCCETIGALESIFELARQYSLDRIAFGRPIGSFQSVKHQLADMSVLLEASRAITSSAVRSVQDKSEDSAEIVSIARSWVNDAGVDIVQGCFQVFGGIGYTWEHDLHLFLRRVTMNSLIFGNADWHRERVCLAHDL